MFAIAKPRLNAIVLAIVAAALAASVLACTPHVERRGNIPDPDILRGIEPGVSSRDQIAELLGSPSSVATFGETFGEETWYYIASRTERFAFYAPKVVDQQVVAIAFDDIGMVRSVRLYGLADARGIEPLERTTPTGGKQLTILQQLVGNLGNFGRTRPPQ